LRLNADWLQPCTRETRPTDGGDATPARRMVALLVDGRGYGAAES